MPVKLVSIAFILAAALSACGGSSTPDAPSGPPPAAGSEDELARSLLLAISDFPDGWIHEPAEPDELAASDPFAGCNQEPYPGQTGKAEGGEFSDADTTQLSVNPIVFVFATEKDAKAALDRFADQINCMARIIRNGSARDEEFAITTVDLANPEIKKRGDETRRFRISYQVEWVGQQPETLVFDVVLVRRDRFITEIDGFRRAVPMENSVLLTYVDKAFEKVESAASTATR